MVSAGGLLQVIVHPKPMFFKVRSYLGFLCDLKCRFQLQDAFFTNLCSGFYFCKLLNLKIAYHSWPWCVCVCVCVCIFAIFLFKSKVFEKKFHSMQIFLDNMRSYSLIDFFYYQNLKNISIPKAWGGIEANFNNGVAMSWGHHWWEN